MTTKGILLYQLSRYNSEITSFFSSIKLTARLRVGELVDTSIE